MSGTSRLWAGAGVVAGLAGLALLTSGAGPTLGEAPAAGPRHELAALRAAPDARIAAPLEARLLGRWAASGSATVDAIMARAMAAEEAGQTVLARQLLDRVIALQPTYAEAWNRRGALRYAGGDRSGALADLNEALRRNPDHFAAWLGAATVLEELGYRREARIAFAEALAIHPNLDAARQGARRLDIQLDGRDI
jgi:tetratricopeptide (TPR) repeat protein